MIPLLQTLKARKQKIYLNSRIFEPSFSISIFVCGSFAQSEEENDQILCNSRQKPVKLFGNLSF